MSRANYMMEDRGKNAEPQKSIKGWLLEWFIILLVFFTFLNFLFKSAQEAFTASGRAEERNNMTKVLKAYVAYHQEKGGITQDIHGNNFVDDRAVKPSIGGRSVHDWAAVLAKFDNSMDDSHLYRNHGDKLGNRSSRKYKSQRILVLDNENIWQLDDNFKQWIPCFHAFASLPN